MIFCNNKLCRFHVQAEEGMTHLRYRLGEGAETASIRRVRIVDSAKKKEFDFCEVCANVLALVNGI